MAECSSCHAQVTWAWTEKGSRIPLDIEEVAGGNLVYVVGRPGGTPTVRYVQPEPDVLRLRSHFASCPNAKKHRRDR